MKPLVAFVTFAAFAAPAIAQMKGMEMKEQKGMDMKMETKKGEARSHHATGTVKSVDAAKGTVMVDHGPVSSMNWPAMSMVFKAKDKKALQGLKPGQKIEFEFTQQ